MTIHKDEIIQREIPTFALFFNESNCTQKNYVYSLTLALQLYGCVQQPNFLSLFYLWIIRYLPLFAARIQMRGS